MKFLFAASAIIATSTVATAANLRASESQPIVTNTEAHRKLYLCDPDCTGDNVGIPVDLNAYELSEALYQYYATGTSVYGNKVNCWDTSQVTDMTGIFQNMICDNMNDPINCWDTSSVTSMA